MAGGFPASVRPMEQPTEERYLMLYGLELIQGQRELRANLIALDETNKTGNQRRSGVLIENNA